MAQTEIADSRRIDEQNTHVDVICQFEGAPGDNSISEGDSLATVVSDTWDADFAHFDAATNFTSPVAVQVQVVPHSLGNRELTRVVFRGMRVWS